MKKLLIALFTCLSFSSFAQQAPIAIVSTTGATKLTSSLDSAAMLAQDNDIIYLPGGTFLGMSDWFKKKVTVIGVGHNIDSANATGITTIAGDIGFQYNGAEGSILDGVYVTASVLVSTNCKIYRTNVGYINNPWGVNANNLVIEKCIIRNAIYGTGGPIRNSFIKNSVISANDWQSSMYNNTFENDIFLWQGAYDMSAASQNIYRNCIFPNVTSWVGGLGSSSFQNNIFATTTVPPLTDSNNAINNILNQSSSATFVSQSGSTFAYNQNYRLKSTSPGINKGTDGKDIGIHGGSSPWVDGNIPPNPTIRSKTVADKTATGGTLHVQFNVRTQ